MKINKALLVSFILLIGFLLLGIMDVFKIIKGNNHHFTINDVVYLPKQKAVYTYEVAKGASGYPIAFYEPYYAKDNYYQLKITDGVNGNLSKITYSLIYFFDKNGVYQIYHKCGEYENPYLRFEYGANCLPYPVTNIDLKNPIDLKEIKENDNYIKVLMVPLKEGITKFKEDEISKTLTTDFSELRTPYKEFKNVLSVSSDKTSYADYYDKNLGFLNSGVAKLKSIKIIK